MAMRDLVTGGAACAVPGSSSSSNPFGALPNTLIGSSSKTQTVSWLVAALVIVINGYLLVEFFPSEVNGLLFTSVVSAFTAAYVAFIIYLIVRGITFSKLVGYCLPRGLPPREADRLFQHLVSNVNYRYGGQQ